MAADTQAMDAARAELVQMASSLLVGPLRPDELIDSAPVDTYLTGILWPRGAPVDAQDDEAGLDAAGSTSADPESASAPETAIPGYRTIRPCSIGISFAVKAGATVVISLGSTARYEPRDASADRPSGESETGPAAPADASPAEPSETARGQDGAAPRPGRTWERRQLGYQLHLPPESLSSTKKYSEFTDDSGQTVLDPRLSVHVRRRVGPGQHVFTVTLINEEPDDERSGPRDARCMFQAEVVVRAVLGNEAAIEPRPMPNIDANDADALTNALLYRDVREFAVGHGVAATWAAEPGSTVDEVRTTWLPASSVKGTDPDGHELLDVFRRQYPHAFDAAYLGSESARGDVVKALAAFADCYEHWIESELHPRAAGFTGNHAKAAGKNFEKCVLAAARIRAGVNMLRTHDAVWTAFALANAAMDRQARFSARGAKAGPLAWRPFQLAFMLLVIPGLVDPKLDDRRCMDLLWFPTGGGKTEAYLGLTAFQIFHQRLTSESRRATGGVDVLMRYTLRLLTVQQFQRAAALITACDFLRESDPRLGTARISLGLYVGKNATPNKMAEAREAIELEQADQKPKSTPRQLLRCPVCGTELRGSAYRADPLLPRIDIVCAQAGCESGGRPLPVLTVDEPIYDTPPSLLIGTIDKFAQIPRSTAIRGIFGLDGGTPPGLIIQDELHLISGPLGSMAGLYETVVDTLCTRDGIPPKVIGSTATIGHAASQVRSLFDRSVLQFPPPGFEARDSFFAVRDDSGPDRLYIGVPTAGRSPKFALQALVAALLQSAAGLRHGGRHDDGAVDPYWSCVAYFNSLRELGGAYVLMQDDVPRQMQFLASRTGTPMRELQQLPVELSSRRSSRELPELLHALSATLADFMKDPCEHEEPRDTVLASNMISVGVDVPRLGLMVVNGQPKSTAEYIQASSRVGRGLPGLVITLYNFGRPRDLSHFEHFRAYHGALYRSVEATSVTPWAPRARDKALHAVLASLVRHLVTGLSGDEDAIRFDPRDPAVQDLLATIRARVAAAADAGEAAEAASELEAIVSEWARRSSEARTSTQRLVYWEKKTPFGTSAPHLMCAAETGGTGSTLAWPTPNSMREVEPSTAFVLKTITRRTWST